MPPSSLSSNTLAMGVSTFTPGAFRHQDLSDCAVIGRFDFHGRLVGLGRERRHQDLDGHADFFRF